MKPTKQSSNLDARIQPNSHIIPRRRDKYGNPLPDRYIIEPATLTHDVEALDEITTVCINEPESVGKHMPRLLARNAIAMSDNAVLLERKFEAQHERANASVEARLRVLETKRSQTLRNAEKLASKCAEQADALGMTFDPAQTCLDFQVEEPISRSALTGQFQLPIAGLLRWFALFKFLAAFGGGGILGISLGLLSDSIQLVDLSREWPLVTLFALLGICLVAITGAAISSGATTLGSEIFWWATQNPKARKVFRVVLTASLCLYLLLIVLVESRTELRGLVKALLESQSLATIRPSETDLFLVSLLVVVPIVSFYAIFGLVQGMSLACDSFLAFQQHEVRQAIRSKELFAKAKATFQEFRSATTESQELIAQISELQGLRRTELTNEEKLRLQDIQADVSVASWQLEELLFKQANIEPSVRVPRKRTLLGWLAKFFGAGQ